MYASMLFVFDQCLCLVEACVCVCANPFRLYKVTCGQFCDADDMAFQFVCALL